MVQRWLPKLKLIAASVLHQALLPIFNLAVSLAVIRLVSAESWGNFVSWLIVAQFVAHITSWGNRDYLLRRFSRSESTSTPDWHSSLQVRALLLFIFALTTPLWGWSLSKTVLLLLWTLLLFLRQSFDVFITFYRTFLLAFSLELIGIALTIATIVRWREILTVEHLVLIFCATTFLKTLALAYRFWDDISFPAKYRLQLADFQPHIRQAAPFFLLGFSGMLQARIDLYSVDLFLSAEILAQYQPLTNWLIYVQAIANFIVLPFVKNIYNAPYAVLLKQSRRLFAIGCLITPPAIWGIRWAFINIYQFNLPSIIWVLGGLYIVPIYFYLILIYTLYKADHERWVVGFNLGFAALNLGLNLLLVPRLGIVGSTAATVVVQWGMALVYWLFVRQHIAARQPQEAAIHAETVLS